jgi:hypothetical protein
MIQTSHRAAVPGDLQAITESRGSLIRNLLTVSLPLSAVVFAAAYLVSRSILIAGLISAVLFLASAVSNIRFFKEIRRRQELYEDDKAVEVIEVHAFRVFDVEPLGSHGPALCFFSDEGKALLLIGQWLLEQRSFPSKEFRLNRWSDTKMPIRIESTAAEIIPEQSMVQLRPDFKIGDVELFNAEPETLQEHLDRAFGGTR